MAKKWNELIERTIDFRRKLHRNPELAWCEKNTARLIRGALDKAGVEWRSCAGTGTVARLAAGKHGRHIAFRADIDGLPVTEKVDIPWKSEVKGKMHACGHDGHTAVLLAAAERLKQNETHLSGPVSFLFQPAEEGGHGAKKMIEDGALKGVDEIYGWHNWPAISFGKATCADGAIMAANGVFKIIISGRGGHASQPEFCRDPVLAASAVTMALQQIVSRRIPPGNSGVVSVTSIDAVSGDTTIPEQAVLGGSVRIDDERLREKIGGYISEITQKTALSYGVTAETVFTPRYDAVKNSKIQAKKFSKAIDIEFPSLAAKTNIPLPIMASEDFSYYLNEIPGAYALIGAGDGEEHRISCHNSQYMFNEKLIPLMINVLIRLADVKLPKLTK